MGLLQLLSRNFPAETEKNHEGLRMSVCQPRFESAFTQIQVKIITDLLNLCTFMLLS
jgi:hypothetical protein